MPKAIPLLAALILALPAAAQDPDRDVLRRHALDLVNETRAEAGLPALTLAPVLTEAAQDHADDMAERDFYAHVSPEGVTPADRFRAAGGSDWALSGENLARCTGCPAPPDRARVGAFQSGWMQSPGHRENILAPGFDRFGYGIRAEGDAIYAVQTFAGPGAGDGGPALGQGTARQAALAEVNARRAEAGLAPLEGSPALDRVAEAALEARLADEDLPDDLFALLPEGGGGWTSLGLASASLGGAGTGITEGTVTELVDTWTRDGTPPGGAAATAFGFAAAARADGRVTGIGVFGGR
ncbi:CAP domain-containing protein [Jannaschia formosa]|uniref:CAP domain-containing protein n=1 Tax=Jannaschia formosa TaxID=2259592 RepID=UPI000E1C0A48|nr:CAP domain-containing protein [Jannaschia formosa]TFL16593.1 CAP domain-containing protein [Jannaschia formosa]